MAYQNSPYGIAVHQGVARRIGVNAYGVFQAGRVAPADDGGGAGDAFCSDLGTVCSRVGQGCGGVHLPGNQGRLDGGLLGHGTTVIVEYFNLDGSFEAGGYADEELGGQLLRPSPPHRKHPLRSWW